MPQKRPVTWSDGACQRVLLAPIDEFLGVMYNTSALKEARFSWPSSCVEHSPPQGCGSKEHIIAPSYRNNDEKRGSSSVSALCSCLGPAGSLTFPSTGVSGYSWRVSGASPGPPLAGVSHTAVGFSAARSAPACELALPLAWRSRVSGGYGDRGFHPSELLFGRGFWFTAWGLFPLTRILAALLLVLVIAGLRQMTDALLAAQLASKQALLLSESKDQMSSWSIWPVPMEPMSMSKKSIHEHHMPFLLAITFVWARRCLSILTILPHHLSHRCTLRSMCQPHHRYGLLRQCQQRRPRNRSEGGRSLS